MADSQGFARDEADPRKRLSPAAARNKQPILDVLQQYLPQAPPRSIDVLELAAGTGEHAAHLAAGLPQVRSWQPTEYTGHAGPLFDKQHLADIFESIVAHTESNPIIKRPVSVDAASKVWSMVGEAIDLFGDPQPGSGARFDLILGINITHISPVEATEGLFAGASRLLNPGSGRLVIYGPFAQRGLELAEGNAKFDAMLKQRELGWKLREVEWLDELADGHAMTKVAMVAMPSDNWTIIYAAPPAARQ